MPDAAFRPGGAIAAFNPGEARDEHGEWRKDARKAMTAVGGRYGLLKFDGEPGSPEHADFLSDVMRRGLYMGHPATPQVDAAAAEMRNRHWVEAARYLHQAADIAHTEVEKTTHQIVSDKKDLKNLEKGLRAHATALDTVAAHRPDERRITDLERGLDEQAEPSEPTTGDPAAAARLRSLANEIEGDPSFSGAAAAAGLRQAAGHLEAGRYSAAHDTATAVRDQLSAAGHHIYAHRLHAHLKTLSADMTSRPDPQRIAQLEQGLASRAAFDPAGKRDEHAQPDRSEGAAMPYHPTALAAVGPDEDGWYYALPTVDDVFGELADEEETAAAYNPAQPRVPAGGPGGGQFGTGSGGATPTNAAPVGQGETGQRVRDLQRRLNALGAEPPLKVDGIFGLKTLAAVKGYQKAHGLKVDGLVGPKTTAALRLKNQAHQGGPAGTGHKTSTSHKPSTGGAGKTGTTKPSTGGGGASKTTTRKPSTSGQSTTAPAQARPSRLRSVAQHVTGNKTTPVKYLGWNNYQVGTGKNAKTYEFISKPGGGGYQWRQVKPGCAAAADPSAAWAGECTLLMPGNSPAFTDLEALAASGEVAALFGFDEDEARDEHGRWTGAGGGPGAPAARLHGHQVRGHTTAGNDVRGRYDHATREVVDRRGGRHKVTRVRREEEAYAAARFPGVVEHHPACPAHLPHASMTGDGHLLACHATKEEAQDIALHLDISGVDSAPGGGTADSPDVTPAAAKGDNGPGNRGNAEALHEYWVHGEGAQKIRWGEGGDWQRCVDHLGKYLADPKGYCALAHHAATGMWTAQHAELDKHAAGLTLAGPAWDGLELFGSAYVAAREYVRDEHGRFAHVPGVPSPETPADTAVAVAPAAADAAGQLAQIISEQVAQAAERLTTEQHRQLAEVKAELVRSQAELARFHKATIADEQKVADKQKSIRKLIHHILGLAAVALLTFIGVKTGNLDNPMFATMSATGPLFLQEALDAIKKV